MPESGGMLSNGELQVVLGDSAEVTKLCFPYVGHESHANDTIHKIGIFVDGAISWLDGSDWRFKARLPHGALIVNTVAVNDKLGVLLEFDDAVSSEANVFIRSVHIVNLQPQARELKLFFHQAFRIGDGREVADTAYFVPKEHALLHYRGRRAFVAGARTYDESSFDQFSVGRFGEPGLDGTWRDAEDGKLMNCRQDNGNTDSIMRLSLSIPAYASQRVQYWLAAATSPRSALSIHQAMLNGEVQTNLNKTATHWHRWLNPSFKIGQKLLPNQRQTFINSLTTLRSSFDNRGAIITDADGICSVHDAAYILWPLIRLGYRDEALRFFTFCKQVLSSDGYLLPAYRADGAWGELSGDWGNYPPIDPADTAMVLFVFAQYQSLHPRSAVLHDFYESLVVPMANFLSQYEYSRDTYTISLSIATLQAAGDLAEKVKDQENSVKWRTASEDMRWAATTLYDSENKMFISDESSKLTMDGFFGAFMFGLVDLDDERLCGALETIDRRLKTSAGLYKRQESDSSASVIASLWMAQYYLETAKYDEAQQIIAKISQKVSKTGLINQQNENSLRSVSEFISTLLDSITKA